jgi:LuxR family maltose regulon positive regulatory protein
MAGRQMGESAPLMRVLANDTAEELPAELLVLRALLLTFRGDLAQSIELTHRALERLPAEDVVLRGFAVRSLGAAYRLNGDVDATIEAFKTALHLCRKTHDAIGAGAALNYLADMHVVRGQLYAAQALYEEALETAVNGKGRRLPVAIKVLVGLAELNRQWNDFAQATRYVEEAIDLGRSWIETWAMGAFIPLAWMKQALGDAAGACEAVQRAERLAVEYDATDIDDIAIAAFKARLWVTQGNTTAAKHWADERGLCVETAESELDRRANGTFSYYLREIEYLTLARLYLAEGRADDALSILQLLENTTERLGRTGILLEILVLQALAFSFRGDHDLALGALERAVLLAQPERSVRVFVDEGTELVPLLRRVAARGVAPRYVGDLLAAFGGTASRAAASRATDTASLSEAAQVLVEPLSERELDVLRLLNTHLTSTLMADELFIAVSTVRSHIKSIYGKLNVHSREEAVQYAQELGLL